ncbi:MAG: hypothetical protein ACFE8U_04355 [Candidatus Hermodarchaeota archaeon]
MLSKPNSPLTLREAIEMLQYQGPLYQRFRKTTINTQEGKSVTPSIEVESQ